MSARRFLAAVSLTMITHIIQANAQPAATRPSSQKTPVEALQKLSNALALDDRAAIDACLIDDGKDQKLAEVCRAILESEGATRRLKTTWKAKFGVEMVIPGFNFDHWPGGGGFSEMFERLLALPSGLETKIDGDTATIRVALPPEQFAGTGANRIAAFGRWSGAMLVFSKVGDEWKLNTHRTINMLMGVGRQPNDERETAEIIRAVTESIGKGLTEIADEIEKDGVASPDEAAHAVQAVCRGAFNDAGVRGTNYSILPVIGG